MKSLFIIFLFCFSWQLVAQTNPLLGTWQVVSIKATDADGTKLSGDASEFKETKIITPTHYALLTYTKEGDSLKFSKATVGRVRIEGNKYIEIPEYASDPNILKEKTNFTYKLEGDKFIQKGTYTSVDGKTGTLDELVFQKVKAPAQNNPAVGVWNQLSSSGVNAKGEKWSHTHATHLRFLVFTPTHYMIFREIDNKFEDAFGGTYTMQGNKFMPMLEMDSKGRKQPNFDITQKVEGGKLHQDGKITHEAGTDTWKDVYERVDKTAKTASTK